MGKQKKVIKIKCEGTQYVDFHKLNEFQEDIKIITREDLDKLKESITTRGYIKPGFVWKHDEKLWILDMHQRLKALTELEKEGWYIPLIPIVEIFADTLEEAKDAVIVFTSQHGKLDEGKLKIYIQKYQIKMQTLVIRNEPIKIELQQNSETKQDNEIPEDVKFVTKEGDLWTLGKHKVLCGDSMEENDVKKLMNGKKAVLGFNDPPYGAKKEIINDNLNHEKLLKFNKKWINKQLDYLTDNGSFYVWGKDEPIMDIYSEIIKPLIKDNKITFRNIITWDKGNGEGQNSENTRMYAIADEKCLFVMCGVQGFNNNADHYFEGWESIRNYLRNECKKANINSKKFHNILKVGNKGGGLFSHHVGNSQWSLITHENYEKLQNYCKNNNIKAFQKEYIELKKEYDELKEEYYKTRAYFNNIHDNFNNVWHFKRENENIKHPTLKPIALCERAIKSSSLENSIIIDFFLGSGSTLIACEKTGRICYGIEIEPHYVDVCVKRYIDWCQKNNRPVSVKLNGKTFDISKFNLPAKQGKSRD